MKKFLALGAMIGLSPTWFAVVLIALAIVASGLLFGYCNSGSKPVEVKPVDQKVLDELNTRDTNRREAAVEKAFEQADAPRIISDEKRAEIKKDVLRDSSFGKKITVEDFRETIRKAAEEEQNK